MALTAACRNCEAPTAFLLETRDYNARVSEETFEYRRCAACGVVGIAELPDDLERFYPADYMPYRMPTVEELPRRAEAERYKLDLIQRRVSGGRLLEIGPSWGGFAYLAREAGYTVEGIEMDPVCCDYLEHVVGVRVYRSADVLALLDTLEQFDVIALWHSLEHLRAPFRILDAVARRLHVGGILVIATPNPEAIQFHLLRSRWVHLDAPRHLHLIPSTALTRRLCASGLTLVHQTLTDPAGRALNRMGWQSSITNLVPTGPLRLPVRLAARLLAEPMLRLDRWSGRGAAYTSVFLRGHGQ